MNNVPEQLIELQTRIVFQEDTLQQLNEVVTQQDQDIRQLQQQVKLLAKRLEDALYTQEQSTAKIIDERPPHY